MEIAKVVLLVLLGLFFVYVFLEAMQWTFTEKRNGRSNSVLMLVSCHMSVFIAINSVYLSWCTDEDSPAPPIVGDVLMDALLLYMLPWAVVHIIEIRGHRKDLEKGEKMAGDGLDGCLPFGLFLFAFAAVMAVAVPLLLLSR